ncbi:uncharacterized protein UTRI_03318 [Ustilago trichophora]|uniref:Uncharacterized protein n=1 Tax=Ustilago trichophora TaxID=86804 RepID=A0A5C3E5J0_9BASI|nr:uncharacterized protein UTRI_03318 [Ustilago trichophora]
MTAKTRAQELRASRERADWFSRVHHDSPSCVIEGSTSVCDESVRMRLFESSYLVLMLVFTGLAACWLPRNPPASVTESEEGIQYIWDSAWNGQFANKLPQRYNHLQSSWATFLISKGKRIVEDYYKKRFGPDFKTTKITTSVRYGMTRFLQLVTFSKDQPYLFDPSGWPDKQKVAISLAEAFAEQQYTAKASRAASKSHFEIIRNAVEEDRARQAQKARKRKEWGTMLSIGPGASGY